MPSRSTSWLLLTIPLLLSCGSQIDDDFESRFQFVGQVQSRDARSISTNSWSIGAETIDRNYSSYETWKAYLGPLGAKSARLQSGWARTDKGNGEFDFSWLDPVVDDMISQGVRPWMSLGYGNPIYAGGGVSNRDSILPSGLARRAWLTYTRQVAIRYRGKVGAYEIWNEPDLNPQITPEQYGEFAFETAKAIRSEDPNAVIILGGFAQAIRSNDSQKDTKGAIFARASLKVFVDLGGKGLAQEVTYHSYASNPDDVYRSLTDFIEIVKSADPNLRVRQGEGGAPSLNQPRYALRNQWWTEESQAKWLLRRAIADAARSIPSSIFTFTELHYPRTKSLGSGKNYKGLLETRLYEPGTDSDDRSVVRSKMAYPAMQAITAIFDNRLIPISLKCRVRGASGPTSVYGFRRDDGKSLIAIWRNGDRPGDQPLHETVNVQCRGSGLAIAPVYVDPLTRAVYKTRDIVKYTHDGFEIQHLPIYDSPVLIADQRLVTVR